MNKNPKGLAALLVICAFWGGEVEAALPSLSTPSTFVPYQSEFCVEHRFNGGINEISLDNFLGTASGANVALAERVVVFPHVEFAASYVYRHRELGLGVRGFHSWASIPLRGQIEAFLYNEKNFVDDSRAFFSFANLSIQEKILWQGLEFTQNVFYCQSANQAGLAFGAAARAFEFLHVILEYMPYLEPAKGSGFTGAFTTGIQLRTYGHAFDFFISNADEIGLYRLLDPVDDTAAHLGFSIRRRFGN